MTTGLRRWALAVAALAVGPLLGSGAARASDALRLIEAAILEHPADVDLRIALGRELYRIGDASMAVEALLFAGTVDPNLAADEEVRKLLVRALARSGQWHDALARLETLLAEGEAGPEWWALRAGLLDRLERPDQARVAWEQAHTLEPDLVDRLRPRARPASTSGLSGSVWSGFEFDSNPRLAGDLPGADLESDAAFRSGVHISWRGSPGEGWSADAGARYERSDQRDLESLDQERHAGWAAVAHRTGQSSWLRLEGSGSLRRLDGSTQRTRWQLRPSWIRWLGDRNGRLEAFAFAGRDLYDRPALSSLERDAWVYGAGLENRRGIRWRKLEGALELGASWRRTDTDGDRDAGGFESAFDHHRAGIELALELALPSSFGLEMGIGVDHAWYDHRNLLGAAFESDDAARRDTNLSVWAGLRRPLGRYTELELRWSRLDRRSNLDLYTTDTNVVGAYLTLRMPGR